MEQFTSIVSHDLQEPIRTIKSFLQLIDIKLGQAQYESLDSYIAKSLAAANRMKELIQHLLDYTQLGKDSLLETEINVEEFISKVLQNLRSTIEATNATIKVESEVDVITGDEVQLMQLLQNLISNALKFTNGSSPYVKIRCTKQGDYIQFAVADNGIGIEDGDRHKVSRYSEDCRPTTNTRGQV